MVHQTHTHKHSHKRTNQRTIEQHLHVKQIIGNRFSNDIFLGLKDQDYNQDYKCKDRNVSLPFRRAMPVINTVSSNKTSAHSTSACIVIARIKHYLS